MTQTEIDLRAHFAGRRTGETILEVWLRALPDWPTLKLLLSKPGKRNLQFSARQRFGRTCVLASLFAHDQFLAMDRRIWAQSLASRQADVLWRQEVLMDSNAVSFMRSWTNGADSEPVRDLVGFLKSVKGSQFDRNCAPYVLESSRLWSDPANYEDLYSTILVHERLEDIDPAPLMSSGKAVFRNPGQAELRTQQKLAEWHFKLGAIGNRPPLSLCDEAYLFLLKIAQLQLESPSPRSAKRKIQAFLEFLNGSIGQIRLLAVWIAWEVFSANQGTIYYFRGVVKKGPHLRTILRNMAWDLMLVFQLHRQFDDPVTSGYFTVPYILTSDRGVDWLLQLDPMEAVAWVPGMECAITFPVRNHQTRLVSTCGEEPVAQLFSESAREKRALRGPLEIAAFNSIVDELEAGLFI